MVASFWELWLLIFRTLPLLLTDLRYLLIFSLVFMLVHGQYKRVHAVEKRMFGLVRGTPIQDTLRSLGYGLFGGVLASVVFILVGISLTDTGIAYLWLTAIVLMLFHPRFLCFSYAGGLISVSYLLFGVPKVDVSAIMALVAVLHLVEAVLIRVNGYQNASPIYVKHSSGKVVGGFSMQQFWPLPFVALIGVIMLNSGIDFEAINMPDWWPLLRPTTVVPEGHSIVYIMFPVIAALGYSDIAITSLPKVKVTRSAKDLCVFSAVLLGLALIADRISALAIVAALFSPLGHELVIHRGLRREQEQAPVFTQSQGVMVLDVYPKSPAETMGLRSGDVITHVNGIIVAGPAQLLEEMTPWLIDPVLTVENTLANEEQREVAFKGKIPPIGIIPVPDQQQGVYMEMKRGVAASILGRWWKKLRR